MEKEKTALFSLILECAITLNTLHTSSPEPSPSLWRMVTSLLYRWEDRCPERGSSSKGSEIKRGHSQILPLWVANLFAPWESPQASLSCSPPTTWKEARRDDLWGASPTPNPPPHLRCWRGCVQSTGSGAHGRVRILVWYCGCSAVGKLLSHFILFWNLHILLKEQKINNTETAH